MIFSYFFNYINLKYSHFLNLFANIYARIVSICVM